LPRATVRALEIAIQSLPTRAPWPPEVDEDWWKEVLADRRLRRSTAKSLSDKDEDAGQRLDRLPVKSLTFSCEWCGQRATLKVAELIAMFGRDRNVRSIGRQARTSVRAAKASNVRSRIWLRVIQAVSPSGCRRSRLQW
jgi:hypothetical protein